MIEAHHHLRNASWVGARLFRDYWGIASGLHQRLDVSGQADRSRLRNRTAAFNLSLFRRAAISFAIH